MENSSGTVAAAAFHHPVTGGAASSLDHRSEKDVSTETEASSSTYDELGANNSDVPTEKQHEAPETNRPAEDEHPEELNSRRKAIIVLALCVGLPLFKESSRSWRIQKGWSGA
jgi:hypothetical protein